MRALNDRVIVELVAVGSGEEAKLDSGLFMPATSSEKASNEAIVVALGPGAVHDGARVPIGLGIGDRVLFLRTGAWKLRVNNRALLAITESDVVMVLDETERAQFVGETIDAAERKTLLGAGV